MIEQSSRTYIFEKDGTVLTSDSTLRFRDKPAISKSLERAGYRILDILDAPDRPHQEFAYISETV
jgi:hypothetical protein